LEVVMSTPLRAFSSFTTFTLETDSFTIHTDGCHSQELRGMNAGDHTAFLSHVVITPTER
jgi:hypothetical protein